MDRCEKCGADARWLIAVSPDGRDVPYISLCTRCRDQLYGGLQERKWSGVVREVMRWGAYVYAVRLKEGKQVYEEWRCPECGEVVVAGSPTVTSDPPEHECDDNIGEIDY